MKSFPGHESTDTVADVLGYFDGKGVRVWSENGQLNYKAPKGTLTREELERLRASRDQIVAFLEGLAEPRPGCGRRVRRIPMAFSQLAHWHLYQLSERRCLRQIASATRLRGPLNVDSLRKSLAEVVRRHDALRTRIVVSNGIPVQEVSEAGDCELEIVDLRGLSQSCDEAEVQTQIDQLILEPIDPTVGPLFGVRLLTLRGNEHVLLVAMEHMISDAFSMNILLRDLFTAYAQASRGRPFSLPPIPVQFPDYVLWRRNAHESWLQRHGAYWNERLAGCRRVRFPVGAALPTAVHQGWGTVPLLIGKELKAELLEWCRERRTTLTMSVFTAYVGLVLRWCGVSDVVIQYQTAGRSDPEVESAIGYFAAVLYLRIELRDDDSFVELLDRVTEEYCRAHEHADFSYLEAQVPRTEFARNTCFNWVPAGRKTDLSATVGSQEEITLCPVPFVHPMLKNLERDNEPMILLYENDDEIAGGMYFPMSRFSVGVMERFGRNFLAFLMSLLRQPTERLKEMALLG